MLNWIPEILDKLTSVVPRLIRITETERGVKWPSCGKPVTLEPGLHWYWPIVTEYETIDVRWRSTVMYAQTITLQDGTSVTARAMTTWRASDAAKCLCESEDIADRVGETTLATVASVLSSIGKEQLQSTNPVNFQITMENREKLAEYGVELKETLLTELAVSRVLRLIGAASE